MCASSCMVWAFRCSALAVCWRAPMPWSKIAGTGIPTPTLKKSPAREPGADFHRRSQLPAGLHPARHLEPHRAAAGNSGHRGAQERQDPGRHRTRADPLPLPARYNLQRFHVLGFPPATGAALPSPGSHSDSRQRLVSQRCRGLGLVRLQPTLAGSASPAALFAGVQPHRATVAIYPKECNPQSLLRWDTEYRSYPPGAAARLREDGGGGTAEVLSPEAGPGEGSGATAARLCFGADSGTPGSGTLWWFAKTIPGACIPPCVPSHITISCAKATTLTTSACRWRSE